MKRFFIFLLLVCCFSISFAQEEDNSSHFYSGQEVAGRWTKSNSPYTISGEVKVPYGKTLTIEAGVVVRLKTGSGSYSKSLNSGLLRVKGKLIAEGTPNDWITFTRDGYSGNWGIIYFDNTQKDNSMKFCRVEYGQSMWGLDGFNAIGAVAGYKAKINIENCIFFENQTNGIVLEGSGCVADINHCIFVKTPNAAGVSAWDGAVANVVNSIFWKNSYAFYVSGTYSKINVSYSNIQGTQSSNNKTGVVDLGNNIYDTDPGFSSESTFTLGYSSSCKGRGKYGEDIGILRSGNAVSQRNNSSNYKTRGDFYSNSSYGDYVKSTLQNGMRVRAIANCGQKPSVTTGMEGTYYSNSNSTNPPCLVVWNSYIGADVKKLPYGFPSDKKNYAFYVKWENIEIIGEGQATQVVENNYQNTGNLTVKKFKTFSNYTEGVYNVKFSPQNTYFALTVSDGTAEVYKLGSILTRTQYYKKRSSGNGGGCAAFSYDEKFYALGRYNNASSIGILSTPDFKEVQILTDHTAMVEEIAFSPDNQFLATSARDDKVIIYRRNYGKYEKIQTLSFTADVNTITFSSNSTFLACGSDEKTAKIFKLSGSSFYLDKTLTGHEGAVKSVVFSPNHQYFATSSEDKTIKIWKISSYGDFTLQQTLRDFSQGVRGLAFSPDNQYLAGGSYDKTLRIWKTGSNFSLVKTINEHSGSVYFVDFSNDGKYLASASADKYGILWEVNCGASTGNFNTQVADNPPKKEETRREEPKKEQRLDVQKFPANLQIKNLKFSEPSGNQGLDENETGYIEFDLANSGLGEATGIEVKLSSLTSNKGLSYQTTTTYSRLDKKSETKIKIPITALAGVQSLSRQFRILVTEQRGFDADPAVVTFETQELLPPDLQSKQIYIDDREDKEGEGYSQGNGNSVIEPNESVEVTAYVQNFGSGKAEGVKVKIILSSANQNITCPDNGKIVELGDIESGDYKKVEFYFYTSRRYNEKEIPLSIEVTEKTGRFSKNIPLGLKLSERSANVVEVNVKKIETKKNTEIKKIDEIRQLSDVDKDLPKTSNDGSNTLAIIIGIEQYKNAPNANYADRDAQTFYQYAKTVFNIPEANIFYCINESATKGEFDKLFGADGWISRRITPNVTNVIVFYSGHGAPDPKTQKGFIIPHDGDPNYPSTNVALDDIYKSLSDLQAGSVTVFLDACFSGTGRANDMLVSGTKAQIRINIAALTSKLTIFSSSSGTEYSNAFDRERHGLFTYFLLKGLKGNAKGNDKMLSINELFQYISTDLQKEARILGKTQTPTLQAEDKEKTILTY